jgi:hypothetical protein
MPITPYFTHNSGVNNFISLSGLSVIPTGFTVQYLDLFWKSWSNQIDTYTNTTFEILVNHTKKYDVPNCSATRVYIGSWQKVGLVITKTNKQNTTTQVITAGIDFDYIMSKDNKCVVVLDFECRGCLCECEQIQVTGDFGWQAGLPDSFIFPLIEAMKKILSISKNTGGTQALAPSDIVEERSRNMTRKKVVNQKYSDNSLDYLSGKTLNQFPEFAKLFAWYRVQTQSSVTPLKISC